MKTLVKITILVSCLLLVPLFTACEREGTMERGGEKIDETMEETGDKVDEAVEETGDKVEDAGEEMQR
jgi:hypothetical protein